MINTVDYYRRQRDQEVGVDEVEKEKVTDPWRSKCRRLSVRYSTVPARLNATNYATELIGEACVLSKNAARTASWFVQFYLELEILLSSYY